MIHLFKMGILVVNSQQPDQKTTMQAPQISVPITLWRQDSLAVLLGPKELQ
jgi:hypothetical protein